MRRWVIAVACAMCGFAQTATKSTEAASQKPAVDPEVARAQIEVDRVRTLVETGVTPRIQLQKAEQALVDAEDSATIRKSIFNQDLTVDQAKQLVAAAERRFERRQTAFDDAKKLVDIGAMPAQNLVNLRQDLDFAAKDKELAEARSKLAEQVAEMAEAEEALQAQLAAHPAEVPKIAERYDGNGLFTPQMLERIETAYSARFGKPLPVSANGETAVHRALGFDHRGRVDVAVSPDQPEGVWLREYLIQSHIPFFAFRQAVPGKATGAHIHIGPMSTRLAAPLAGGG